MDAFGLNPEQIPFTEIHYSSESTYTEGYANKHQPFNQTVLEHIYAIKDSATWQRLVELGYYPWLTEQINVTGITFRYTEEGFPQGLCRADRLFYVTTAGGCYVPEEFGFGYIKALAQNFYGIQDIRLIKASGLDIDGADVNDIMAAAEETLENMEQTAE
jgi:hypothetical protein